MRRASLSDALRKLRAHRPRPGSGTTCPRCGHRFRESGSWLVDPRGRWAVCARCGYRTDLEGGQT